MDAGGDPEALFAGYPTATAAFRSVRDRIATIGTAEIRTTKTQVAFKRRRGFAILWRPGQWLKDPDAEVVLSIALPRHDGSPRWKQVVHPSPGIWMHHLEIQRIPDIDREVVSWLREAWEAAAPRAH